MNQFKWYVDYVDNSVLPRRVKRPLRTLWPILLVGFVLLYFGARI